MIWTCPQGHSVLDGTPRVCPWCEIERLGAAVLAEREACAQLAEAFSWWDDKCPPDEANKFIARDIRARGKP